MPALVVTTGVAELDAMLKALPAKLQRKLVRGALRTSGKLVLASAKANVPVDTGALKKTLALRAGKRSRSRMSVEVQMPTRDKLARAHKDPKKAARILKGDYYPAFLEYGAPHMAARPFLRPALHSNRRAVVEEFRKDVREAIGKAK